MNRHLAWEGCYNVRDLGGLPTEDGQQTRRRQIIRADLLGRLTDRGKQQLLDYGVRTIIDLRWPWEVAQEPSVRFGLNPLRPHYMNLPLERSDPQARALIEQAQSRAEVYCIVLDHYSIAVAEILQAVAHAAPGGVVIHCHAGKDRTGTIAALLLRLAGVPTEAVAEDFAESQGRLWPWYDKLVARAGGEDKVEPALKPTATAEMMISTLNHLEAGYGGVRNYLVAAGMRVEDLSRLKRRLRVG